MEVGRGERHSLEGPEGLQDGEGPILTDVIPFLTVRGAFLEDLLCVRQTPLNLSTVLGGQPLSAHGEN